MLSYFQAPVVRAQGSCISLVNILASSLFNHEIPNWLISNISATLLQLDLGSNSLKGEIPHGISNFLKLEILEFGENHLTGNIPESIGQLKHLTVLDLEINYFCGPIPSSPLGIYLSCGDYSSVIIS